MADAGQLNAVPSRRRLLLFVPLLLAAACTAPTRTSTPDVHIVRSGETLFSIAWRYGKDAKTLARWNGLGDGSLIYPGQRIRLAPGAAVRRAPAQAPRPLPELPAEPPPAWAWPTKGRVTVAFGGKPGTGTGVLIDGRRGQAVRSAAEGRVVYAGSGLIGYGQLLIIKHNETYLSAYGYVDELLVAEGDAIRKGQSIARMGEGPERKPRLHFEIRRNGTPIDPMPLLGRR